MKKIFLLCAASLLAVSSHSQGINPGFEMLNSDGTPAYWLPLPTFIVIPTDTTCTWIGADSTAFITTDAHSGNYAYEMRAANYCDSFGLSGNIRPSRYIIDSGFSDLRLPFAGRPAGFTFYYKLRSVMDDHGYADALLENDNGTVAQGSVTLTASTSQWAMATVPMAYENTETPMYLTMRYWLRNDSVVHYGSRFVIDDMSNTDVTAVTEDMLPERTLRCYPVPATDRIHLQLDKCNTSSTCLVVVSDVTGREVERKQVVMDGNGTMTLEVGKLAQGTYFVAVSAGDEVLKCRFVK